MLKHDDQSTGLDYMEETLSYLALKGSYNIDLEKVLNLLSATNQLRNTHWAHMLCLQHCQDEPFSPAMTPQVYHLRETHVRGVCRCINLSSLHDVSEDFAIPNFRQLFHTQIQEDWGHKVSGLVLRYDQDVLLDSIFIKLQTGL